MKDVFRSKKKTLPGFDMKNSEKLFGFKKGKGKNSKTMIDKMLGK